MNYEVILGGVMRRCYEEELRGVMEGVTRRCRFLLGVFEDIIKSKKKKGLQIVIFNFLSCK